MPKLIHCWQWGPGYAAEQNLADICKTALAFGFDGILVKCLDGLDWAATYFDGQDAPGSLEQVYQQWAYANERGLKYYAGVNPLYLPGELEEEGGVYGDVANVVDGLVLDVEPYPQFWGDWRPPGAAKLLMETIRAVAPAAQLVFQPDPRPARLYELRPEEWVPYCDVIAGQHYWNDFQSDPRQEMANAAALGEVWGKPSWPTLPGNAPVESFPLDLIAGFPGLIAWRLGTTGPQVLAVLGELQMAGGEDPPPPSQPSYEELQTIIGYLTHDLMDGFESEANRKPIRKSQLLALVENGRSHSLT